MPTPTEKATALATALAKELAAVLRKHNASSVLKHAEASEGAVILTVEIKSADPKTLAEEVAK